MIESGNTTLQVQAIRVLANIGLGNSDEAQKIFSALEKEIENSRSANALTLFHEAEDALSTSNWAHQQSEERLRILAEKAQSPNVRPLDLSRYSTELRITPYEELRDLDLALELAENALEIAKRTKDPGLMHRLADLYEIHIARNASTEVNKIRDELIKLHESKIVAAIKDEDDNTLVRLYKLYMKLHMRLEDEYSANRLVEIFCTRFADDPNFLNSLAWSILSSGQPPSNPGRFALIIAEVACSKEEADGGKNLGQYLDTLALAYSFQGTEGTDQRLINLEKALEIQRRALSLIPGDANKQTVNDMNSMLDNYLTTIGLALKKQERYVEAEPLFLEAYEKRKKLRGETNRYTLGAMTNVGLNYNDMEKFEEARKWLGESMELKRKHLPTKDPLIHTAEHGLQRALKGLGLHEEELALRNIILNIDPEVIESPDADARTLNNAAWSLMDHSCGDLHDPNRALPLAERACSKEEAAGGEQLWNYLDTLALAQHMSGDTQKALDTQKRAVSLIPVSANENAREDLLTNLKKYEAILSKAGASS